MSPPPSRGRTGGGWGSLIAGDIPRVIAAEVVSNFGSMLSRLAIPWLAVLALSATPLQMGWLALADVVAGAIAALLLGALVDRASNRSVMIGADLLRAAVLASVALLAALDLLTIGLLVAAAAAGGVLTMAFELARSAWFARSIAQSELATRNSQLAGASAVSESASFAIGGWLFQLLGGALALVVDAVSYVISALLLIDVREPPRERGDQSTASHPWALLAEVRDGLHTVAREPTLRRLAVLEALVALAMSLAGTSYLIYVTRDLGFSTGVLGMIFAVGGVGSALGAALIPIATAATMFAVSLLVAHQLIGDGGHVMREIHDRTLRQSIAPAAQLARVDSSVRLLGQIATVAGAIGGGAFATALGARSALVGSAICFAVAAAFAAQPMRIDQNRVRPARHR